MTTDQAQQQLASLKGSPLTPAELQQAQQMLQASGWQPGGDISTAQFSQLAQAGQQVWGGAGAGGSTLALGGSNPTNNPNYTDIETNTIGAPQYRKSSPNDIVPGQPGGPPAAPTDTGGPAAGPASSGGGPAAPAVTPPDAFHGPPAWAYKDFQGPSAADVLNDPSYQFEVNQGLGAIGANRAAAGTLNTGGTLKDYIGYASNLASTKWNDAYSRDLTTYQQNRQNSLDAYNTNYNTQYKDPYQINYQTQVVDPFQMKEGQYQFGATLDQNQSQFTASQAQQDKIAQEQFGLSYAQLNAQQKAQADQLAQQQGQFTATQAQNQNQFSANLDQTKAAQKQYYDFNTWLQNYNMNRQNGLDAFNEKYQILGML